MFFLKLKKLKYICLFASFVIMPAKAKTKIDREDIEVKIKIIESCTVSVNGLDFGMYNSLSHSQATTNIAVLCTNGTGYKIGLDLGQGTNTKMTSRKMSQGNNIITYGLYKDAARTDPWGDNGGDRLENLDGTGTTQNWTVYGKIFAGQNVPDGDYSDIITVTVDF